MDTYAQIKEKIKQIAGGKSAYFHIAEVSEVKGDVCDVVVGEKLKLTGVRLRSVINKEDSKLIITPKKDSKVVVADLSGGNLSEMVVIAYSEVEKVEAVTNNIKVINPDESLTVEIDGQAKKVDIKNNDVSLKDLMQSIADIINQLTLATPAGPSGTPLPPTVDAVAQFIIDFEKLLK